MMHALSAALAASVLALSSVAAADTRPRTCLVLGGGGARGAAHIGVLRVLERERVPIDCVVGTSMGAIVGGLYSSGFTADEIDTALQSIDWTDVFHDDPPRGDRSMRRKEDDLRFMGGAEIGIHDGKIALPQGLVQGQKLLLVLRRLTLSTWDIEDFDDLPLPFRAIAADIGTGEKVVFAAGDVATAIRASMSVPGAFAPIRVDGRLLVDGGMVDNVPVDEGRKLGAERLIVVAVGSPMHREEELTSPFAVANQMLTALMKGHTEAQLATLGADDLLIVPELGRFSARSFDQAEHAVAIGQAAAEKAAPDLRRYAVSTSEYTSFQAKHRALPFDAPLIAFLDVQKNQSNTAQHVERRLQRSVGKPLDVSELEKEIGIAYGEGSHESIKWDLQRRNGTTGLAVTPIDKEWGPDFLRFGLRLSDDFDGRSSYQLLGQLNFTGLNSNGGEALLRLETGRILNGHIEFYQPWGSGGRFSVAPYLDYKAFNIPQRETSEVFLAEIRRSEFVGGLEVAFMPDNKWRLSAAVERGHEDGRIHIGDPSIINPIKSDIARIRPRIEYDTLDSAGFPSRGVRLDLSEEFYMTQLGSDYEADVTRLTADLALSHKRHRGLLGIKLGSAHGGQRVIGTYSTLGGLTNFSGYTDDEILASQIGLARAVYYVGLGRSATPSFHVGGSLELGGFWEDRDAIDTDDMMLAGSLFVGFGSPLGPIFVGYGQAEGGIDSFYLRFGPLLRSETDF